MVKKAVIRRASKQWPLSDDSKYSQLLTAIQIDNTAESNEQRATVRGDQIESEMDECINENQVETIKDLCSTQNLDPAKVYSNYGVNALSKLKLKDFDEINNKLLDRQRKFNAANPPKEDGAEEPAQAADEAPESSS
jgi:hypothetical protein